MTKIFAFVMIGFIVGSKGFEVMNSSVPWINASLHCKDKGKDLACISKGAIDVLENFSIEYAWVDSFLTFSSWMKKLEECYEISKSGLPLPKKYKIGTCQLMCGNKNKTYFSIKNGICICFDDIESLKKLSCSISRSTNVYAKENRNTYTWDMTSNCTVFCEVKYNAKEFSLVVERPKLCSFTLNEKIAVCGFDKGSQNCLRFDDVLLGIYKPSSAEITCGLYSLKGYTNYSGKEHLLIEPIDKTLLMTIGQMSVKYVDEDFASYPVLSCTKIRVENFNKLTYNVRFIPTNNCSDGEQNNFVCSTENAGMPCNLEDFSIMLEETTTETQTPSTTTTETELSTDVSEQSLERSAKENGLSTGLIIGVVVGLCIMNLVTLTVLFLIVWKRKFKKHKNNPYETPFSNNVSSMTFYENRSPEETPAYESLQTERMPNAIYVNTNLQT